MKKINKIYYMLLFMPVLLAFMPASEPVEVPKWNVDKAHSTVSFKINHFFTPVTGRFSEFDIDFVFDPNDLAGSKVKVVIKVNSVNTGNEKRDNDLRSDNFFGSKTYPEMTYESEKIERTDENEYMMHGKLTIKETTKDVAIPFTVLGTMDHPRRKGVEIMSVKSELKINRNEYGVGTGDWIRTNVVGDEITIQIFIEANRKK
ncbi:MAG: YceI family protein [Bacteroidetes bacterium]|nr:YceI family protein [Bacteroidota bacterium]